MAREPLNPLSGRFAPLVAGMALLLFAQPLQSQRGPTSSLLLLIDVSGSMGAQIGNGDPEIKIDAAKEAASSALRQAVSKGTVEVAILAFEGDCAQPVPRYADFTSNFAVLDRFIGSLQPGGGTPMAPALLYANRFMRNEGSGTARDQMIVLLADGQNDCGSVSAAMAELRASGVIFRHETIGFGIEPNSIAATDLRDIATASGGTYHHAADATQLGDLFEEFVDTFTVIDLLGTFGRPPTAAAGAQPSVASPSPTNTSPPGPVGQVTDLLGRFGRRESRQGSPRQPAPASAADAGPQTRVYFVAVAANSSSAFDHTFRSAWAFGYHTDSGADAIREAVRACNAAGRGGCASLGISSMRGGCAAVAQARWVEKGRPPQGRLHSGTSSLGRGAAEGTAVGDCRAFTGAGMAPGALLQSDCSPLATFCSSDVGQ